FTWISPDFLLLIKMLAAGVVFGFVSRIFSWSSHLIRSSALRYLPSPWLRPVIGGLLVIAISFAIGSSDYLGLGVSNPDPEAVSILSSFNAGGADPLSWFWKLLLTAITLGFGFRGGEVTPLFFVGASLGNIIAVNTGSPVDLFAAAGFIAVFAGATNTPVACTLMGIELFGIDNSVFFAVACFASYACSGHKGIYSTQRSDNVAMFL
ncbi:MAG: voltage-gated chloride channel protein, partial [Sphingobacteriales bacterium]